jgi:hypothetical protein
MYVSVVADTKNRLVGQCDFQMTSSMKVKPRRISAVPDATYQAEKVYTLFFVFLNGHQASVMLICLSNPF